MKKVIKYAFMALTGITMTMTANSCKSSTPKTAQAEAETIEEDSTAEEKAFTTDSIAFDKASRDSSLTARIVVDYPTGNDELANTVRQYINKEIGKQYLPVCNEEHPKKEFPLYKGSLEDGNKLVKHYGDGTYIYLQENQKELQESNENDTPHMSFELTIRKTVETPLYLTYKSTSYIYLAGAHGSSSEYGVNIDKATGKAVEKVVDGSKVKEMQSFLHKGAVSYFKAQGDNDVTEKNLNDYLFIENNTIPMPSHTPFLDKDGVHFVYQPYEIGPYAIGMVSFVVPYKDIKPFMTAEALKLAELK